MTKSKKTKSKISGKVHTCSDLEPSCQSDHVDALSPKAIKKPDFKKLEKKLTPNRKASGPSRKRSRSISTTIEPSTPDVIPKGLPKSKS